MKAIEILKQKLREYPDLNMEIEKDTISVNPQNGFTIWLTEYDSGCTVGYDGWHEEFKDKEKAIKCFCFGLSDKCRLKVSQRGSVPYKWTFEFYEDGEWKVGGTTGLIFFPYWRKRKEYYLQNKVHSS